MTRRILLVEDDASQALTIEAILSTAGYDCKSCASAEDAWTSLEADRFDVVVSDVRLPGASGFELCARIKADSRIRSIPVLLLSVLSESTNVLEGLASGADAFLSKPVPPPKLLDTVGEVIFAAGQQPGAFPLQIKLRGLPVTLSSSRSQILGQVLELLELERRQENLRRRRSAVCCQVSSRAGSDQEPGVVRRGAIRYGELVFSATEAAVVTSLERVVLDLNSMAELLLGRSRAQLVGHSITELVAPEELDHQAWIFEGLREGRPSLSLCRKILHPDGSVRFADIASTRVDFGGEQVVVSTLQDVTERQRALQGLATAHEVAQVLAESSSLDSACELALRTIARGLQWEVAGCWHSDTSGSSRCHAVFASPGCRADEFLRRTRELTLGAGEGLIGRVAESGEPVWITDVGRAPWFTRTPEADLAGLRTAVGVPLRVEERVVGVLELLSVKALPLDRQLLGTLVSIGLQLGQYCERRSRLGAVYDSEGMIRLLLDSTREAIFGIDLQGNCTFANRACAELLSRPRAGELVGKGLHELLRLQDPEHSPHGSRNCELLECLLSGRPFFGHECHAVTEEGRLIPAEIRAIPLYRGAELIGGVICMDDLTDRKRIEAELCQAQKMQAFGQLAGGVAHDFNNLLTVISGHAQFLADGLSAEGPMKRDVETILKTAERASGLTRQLLTFSRKQAIQPRTLDLNTVVGNMSQMLRRLIGEDITLTALPDSEPRRAVADPTQLDQVILNLCVNARDAMPQGGTLTLRVSGSCLAAPGAYGKCFPAPAALSCLAVEDTGCGIPPEVLPRIFEPFFTTKGPGRGTGLGLATVLEIVERAGGRLHVDSQPGKGTRFCACFPAAEAAAQPDAGLAESRPRPASCPKTILVVDDDDAIREFVLALLRRRGYAAIEARSGSEALRLVQEHAGPIDAVVTDVVMPGLTARQFLEQLAQLRPATPVLHVSGYSDEQIGRQGVPEVGTALLNKPFTAEQLFAALDRLLA